MSWKFVFVALIFLPATLLAQIPSLRVGQEVRIHADTTANTITGRVSSVTNSELGIVRTLDAPPVHFPWYNLVSIEVHEDGVWRMLWQNPGIQAYSPKVKLTPSDSSWMAGNIAGAQVAASLPRSSYFAPAFLSGVGVGFFWLFTFCSDCNPLPRLAMPAGVAGIAVTSTRAQKAANTLPPSIAQQIDSMSPSYQLGFREGYRQKMSSKSTREIIGGALVGGATGFAALIGLLAAAFAD